MNRNGDSSGKTAPAGRGALLLSEAALSLAITAALMLVTAGFGTRLGLWPFSTGFVILKYGSYCGLLTSAIALAGIAASLRVGRFLGLVLAFAALAGGVTAFGIPYSWKLSAQKLPRIHDITTDINTPPQFVAVLPLRKDAPNPSEYGGAEIAAIQTRAYPDIKTLVLGLPPEKAHSLVLDTARRMGWKIVADVPAAGRIEATDTTFWFGFKDDIVIRITPAGDRSLVDVRSVSRVGISDVGTNARRIRDFLKKLERRS